MVIKRSLILATIIFTAFICFFTYGKEHKSEISLSAPNKELPFQVGETLVYEMSWMGMKAGTSEIKISEITQLRGRITYHIEAIIKTSYFFSKIFKVDDHFHSYLDTELLMPLYYAEHIREGEFKIDRFTSFYPEKGYAEYKGIQFPLPAEYQDPLTSLFAIRANMVPLGESLIVNTYSRRRHYPIKVTATEEAMIQVKAGNFWSVLYMPVLTVQGRVFTEKENKIFVWIAKDPPYLPVLITSKVMIGSVKAELVEYKLGKHIK